MNCQVCSSPATVHLTHLVNGQKEVTHLCQRCAEQQQLMQKEELNLSAIVQALIGQHVGQAADELARLSCPTCGISYMEFRNSGRLGCPNDDEVFRPGLGPLLQRIHRSDRHQGKAPRGVPELAARQAELMGLRRQLHAAVEGEAYEEAARLRDLLREKEATDESG
jgi:protein arginine kinase activator